MARGMKKTIEFFLILLFFLYFRHEFDCSKFNDIIFFSAQAFIFIPFPLNRVNERNASDVFSEK